ncbi:MAG TPA: hypothetical protein VJ124_07930 [Pyrinomonadaceae bacterium]|nr:hypothetical protein [Pyrinomonadaceae bacterium]
MSEIKLNLIDADEILVGTTHGSVGDRCVAALAAEPETIAELEAALARYMKPTDDRSAFASFRSYSKIDEEPWDAGILVIDLAARIVASESTYSQPGLTGQVHYHDGNCATDVAVVYRLPEDWVFLDSTAAYEALRDKRRQRRAATPPLDARAVLYGRPLLEFLARECMLLNSTRAMSRDGSGRQTSTDSSEIPVAQRITSGGAVIGEDGDAESEDELQRAVSALHARWLITPRDDLRGQSPRDVLFARRDSIDSDLDSRAMQWSLQGEGPPTLATDSYAYRFGGFGTHEWVVYYDLLRHLIWSTVVPDTFGTCKKDDLPDQSNVPVVSRQLQQDDLEATIEQLEHVKTSWLEAPEPEYDGRTPAIIIGNERKRLPIAMRPRDMIIDEDCPVCQMMADESALGLGVGFWHLDGSHMDDDFTFSPFATREEWETEQRHWREFNEKYNRDLEAGDQRLVRGELVDS